MANKNIYIRNTKLHDVTGRIDYISSPKRQENLEAFYQTVEDPTFWRQLAAECRERSKFHPTGKTTEARELVISLANDFYGRPDLPPELLAKTIADDFRDRYGVECAVALHWNKTKTNFHAHVVFPERQQLKEQKVSIAPRNTYYDSEGKRSTKKACVGADGELLPGCRLVQKGEALNVRAFSVGIEEFSTPSFLRGEKRYYAQMMNVLGAEDHWQVYSRARDVHLAYIKMPKGDPERLRRWKEAENKQIAEYNEAVDRALESGEITTEQAMQAKFCYYELRRQQREERAAVRERWNEWSESRADFEIAWQEYQEAQWYATHFNRFGMRRTAIELLVILLLELAGVDWFGMKNPCEDKDLVAKLAPPYTDPAVRPDVYLQEIYDMYRAAAGLKTTAQMIAEKKVLDMVDQAGDGADRKPGLDAVIAQADVERSRAEDVRSRQDPVR